MNARCRGCKKGFSHSGLSKHISKTHDMRCRAVYSSTSQTHPGFRPIHHASVLPSVASIPNPMPRINSDEGASEEEYGPVGNNDHIEDDSVDPADAVDAEAFEALSQGPLYLPSQEYTADPPALLEDPGRQPTRIEASKSGVTVVIVRFPFGSAGAPIDAPLPPHENASSNRLSIMSHSNSIWAPFRSQRDWEIAHWAKMRGPTSTAVNDLLAIPEVCPARFHLYRH